MTKKVVFVYFFISDFNKAKKKSLPLPSYIADYKEMCGVREVLFRFGLILKVKGQVYYLIPVETPIWGNADKEQTVFRTDPICAHGDFRVKNLTL